MSHLITFCIVGSLEVVHWSLTAKASKRCNPNPNPFPALAFVSVSPSSVEEDSISPSFWTLHLLHTTSSPYHTRVKSLTSQSKPRRDSSKSSPPPVQSASRIPDIVIKPQCTKPFTIIHDPHTYSNTRSSIKPSADPRVTHASPAQHHTTQLHARAKTSKPASRCVGDRGP